MQNKDLDLLPLNLSSGNVSADVLIILVGFVIKQCKPHISSQGGHPVARGSYDLLVCD